MKDLHISEKSSTFAANFIEYSTKNAIIYGIDVVTEFRGRGWEIRVRPLSFAEYFEAVGGEKRDALEQYYNYGGLPAVVNLPSPEAKQDYLRDIYRTIYLKDIIERNHLQNEEGMEQIFQVLASAMGSAVNPAKMAN